MSTKGKLITIDPDNKDVREIMGLMIFTTAPIAHVLRKAGDDIPQKVEAEQAAVLLWLLTMRDLYGENWRKEAGAELDALSQNVEDPATEATTGA